MNISVETAKDYIESTLLPEIQNIGLESVEDPTSIDFSTPELAVTIGSQIASFAKSIEPELKEKITNAFLFAQQAADKHLEDVPEATSLVWYHMYGKVLSQIGWTYETDASQDKEFKGTSAAVHEEILPILTLALGGAAIASSTMLIKVLEGLNKMDEDSPWITLFNKESQRARENQFQLSHVDKVDGAPRITLVNLSLTAKISVTQVLFFRLDNDNSTLQYSQRRLSVNEPIFSEVAPDIAARLKERARKFVRAIEI